MGETRTEGRTREIDGKSSLVYLACRYTTMIWVYTLHRLRVRGTEHIPREGPALIASNHQSFLDIPVIAASTRRHVAFVARDSLTKSKIMAFIIDGCRAIKLKRGTADRAGLKAMIRHLELDDLVSIFPEGTRSEDGSLAEIHGGALVAARRTDVPVIPAAIRGAFVAFPKGAKRPRWARISIEYGAPIDPKAPDALENLRDSIQAMLGDGRFE